MLTLDELPAIHLLPQRANRIARQLLDQHHPSLVTSAQAAELERMAVKFQKRAIEMALNRIDSGDYGYCEETGDEIGLPRLKANPTARLSLDAQERMERQNRLQGAG